MPKLIEQIDHFRVGYVLPPRKIQAFMNESFINYAKERGIEFVPINVSKPLTEQGPFDCILHKTYGDQWNLNLENFLNNNPNATVIDRPSAIQRLHNRISMLEPVTQLNIPRLGVPNQLLVQDSESLKSIRIKDGSLYLPQVENASELTFPVIAKPLTADGTTKAHSMSIVFDLEGLTNKLELEPPMVLQQFVNHGGTIFKVYVVGEYVTCVKRRSLPDISNNKVSDSGGAVKFSRISSGVVGIDDEEKIKMPETKFLDDVAKGLRLALGLHLFNFDMIKDDKSDGYLVIDINYFPGYEKLPNYESVMINFFLDIKKSKDDKKLEVDETLV
ncbi:inositol-tetrakisphosphate 1-kinase 1-like [Rutidosis leptorrhynchoides]|uniref:inositol-tetrakisphosphate 1-kinase 1-like n=1 Tax=Rutidosis leptorrhynchoides TaxID=125765 RepID=UPI003A99F1F2